METNKEIAQAIKCAFVAGYRINEEPISSNSLLDSAWESSHAKVQHDCLLAKQADAAPVGGYDPSIEAALDAAYPIPDSPHTSVLTRAHDNRCAFERGWYAAITQRAGSEAVPVEKPFHHYGLSAEQVQQLLKGSLKPEEISGAEDVQHSRVNELVWWFARLTQGNANPKWAVRHACELAYFVATNGINRSIDLESVKSAAFKEGVNITPAERGTLERIGFATPPAAPLGLTEEVRKLAEGARNLGALYYNTNCNPEGFQLEVDALAKQARAILAAASAKEPT